MAHFPECEQLWDRITAIKKKKRYYDYHHEDNNKMQCCHFGFVFEIRNTSWSRNSPVKAAGRTWSPPPVTSNIKNVFTGSLSLSCSGREK
jgi:hypothetical protein